MRIFLAGATGAIGKALLPQLLQAGHEVTAMARSPEKLVRIQLAGVKTVAFDALDRDAVMREVTAAKPDAIIHELTALPATTDFRKFDQQFALTNRLRSEGLDYFIAAAKKANVRRFIAQSFTGWTNERVGDSLKTEQDPLDLHPPPALRSTLQTILYLEQALAREPQLNGMALRYGFLYGPNTSIALGGAVHEAVMKRKLPVVGNGAGVWSFIHVEDAASATLAALTSGVPRNYNIVDDEPAPVREWLPYLAKTLGAPSPLHVPKWIARFFVGEAGVVMMTDIRGSSNARAKRELAWHPRFASWRDGFVSEFARH